MEQNTEQTEAQTQTEEKTAAQKTVSGQASLRRLKFETGLIVLFAAMAAMAALAVMSMFISGQGDGETTLLTNAFEAFKLIAVTVLGYIFGAARTGSDA